MRRRQKKRFDHGQPISKIDTRPIVFVALFVAVFALINARSPQHALIIDLVSDFDRYFETEPNPIIIPAAVQISPTETGAILWNCQTIGFSQLRGLLQDSMQEAIEPIIVFHPAPNASYDLSVKVLNEIEKVGATKLRFEGLEPHRKFNSAQRTSSVGARSSLSMLSSISIVEMPEEFRPKAIDEINCDSGSS
jgi:biopolymer transport protein ExbD